MRNQGFTLIEVIIAMAIVALSFAALLTALQSFSQQHIGLRNRIWSQSVAWNKAVNIHIEARTKLAGRESGKSDMLQTAWRWQVEVNKMNDGLYRVDVDAGELNARNYVTRLTTLVSSPGMGKK